MGGNIIEVVKFMDIQYYIKSKKIPIIYYLI